MTRIEPRALSASLAQENDTLVPLQLSIMIKIANNSMEKKEERLGQKEKGNNKDYDSHSYRF